MCMWSVSYWLGQFDGASKSCSIKCLKDDSDPKSRYKFQGD